MFSKGDRSAKRCVCQVDSIFRVALQFAVKLSKDCAHTLGGYGLKGSPVKKYIISVTNSTLTYEGER